MDNSKINIIKQTETNRKSAFEKFKAAQDSYQRLVVSLSPAFSKQDADQAPRGATVISYFGELINKKLKD